MLPKIEKKQKSPTSTETEPILLSLEEMKSREIKYSARLMELQKCRTFIEDAILLTNAINEQQLLQYKWVEFLSCSPLPKPYLPQDVRLFYNKLKHIEKENKDKDICWLLSVNERSLLSQDIFRQDLTRRHLNVTLRGNIGHEYDDFVKDSIFILRRIDNFLDDPVEVSKCPIRIFDDIVKRKLAIQGEIIDFIDSFTYRIISSENAEMDSIDGISAEYFFNAFNFNIHIWCLKNVAIRFSCLSKPRLLANFHSINVQLHVPAEMLKENLVIRSLHMKFDHLSENAKSFQHKPPPFTENHNAVILDLPKCLSAELSMQKEMQIKKHNELKENYLKYEVLKRQYEEQVEKQKHSNKNEKGTKKRTKMIKPPKEPLYISDNMVPDIYEEFLEKEKKHYENLTKEPFKPELLNLSSDEINLRKYVILGGIYQLYYVQKPLHTDFNSFNMTWHKYESKLVIDKHIKITTGSGLTSQSDMRMSKRFLKRMSAIEVDKISSDPDIKSPWFVLTIELPEYLCNWGNPIACHFEEKTENHEPPPSADIFEDKDGLRKSKSGSNSNSKNMSSQNNLHSPVQDHIFLTPLTGSVLNKRKSEMSAMSSLESLHVNDFSLLGMLKKPQIRDIERHIIPRIISSYKFPKEVDLEDLEMLNRKHKGKGGIIVRQRNADFVPKLSGKQFTFNEHQNNPERVFVKFPKVKPLHILSYIKSLTDAQGEPETFAQLLKIVDDIKEICKSNKNKTLYLKPLDHKIKTQNKRIKQMLRHKEHTTSKSGGTGASASRKTSVRKSTESETKSSNLDGKGVNETENLTGNHSQNILMTQKENWQIIEGQQTDDRSHGVKYLCWTTQHILNMRFDRKNRKVIIQTDRLGNFGFAFKSYEHFPYKNWTMEPSEEDPENEVIFTLDTQYVRCVLHITASGVRGHVTEPTKTFVRYPKIYLLVEQPIQDFRELKQIFKEKYLNIFPENDASFYIENGFFSEKHISTELHTYNCMAVHSTQMCFKFSLWNRLAARRDIILKFHQYKDLKENLVEIRITPGEAFFVDIQELCSEDLNVIKLHYNLTWRNIESYSDLHHLIVSMYPAATDLRCKNLKMICFIKDFLSKIRPLSFS